MPDETVAFKAEITQLLDILVHSLYTEREIFLRELLSNASDALHRLQLERLTREVIQDPEAEAGIWLRADPEAGTLVVRDSGLGMTRDELVQNLGTIAHSGARNFADAMRSLDRTDESGARALIGRFGVGFYSVFMVADEVEVVSRSLDPEEAPAHWRSDGRGGFTVGPVDQGEGAPPRGTEVRLHLREDAREFLDPERLTHVVRAHSNYVPFPIYVHHAGDEPWRQANEQTALWRERPADVTEEQHTAFLQQLRFGAEAPLLTIHYQADVPLQFHALLYVPARRDPMLQRDPEGDGLRLYARKVLIEEHNRSLLPRSLRFLVGVVDSEDLPLNVSRERVQSSPMLSRIRGALSKRVLAELARLPEEDPERFQRFLEQYAPFLKEAVATDGTVDERVPELLRFRSTHAASVSLSAYVERMPPTQSDIYYLQADDAETAATSPHLEPLRRRGLEVLLFTDPMDAFLPLGLSSYREHRLRDVAEADLELPPLAEEADGGARPGDADDGATGADFDRLLARAREVLGEDVAEVRASRVLTRSPARLSAPPGLPSGLERLRRLSEEGYRAPPRVLELNPGSELLRSLAARLAADPKDPLVPDILRQLLEAQWLLEGIHPNPSAMAGRLESVLLAASRAPAAAAASAPPSTAGEAPRGTPSGGTDASDAHGGAADAATDAREGAAADPTDARGTGSEREG